MEDNFLKPLNKEVRSLLQNLARDKIKTRESKKKVLSETRLKKSHLESMIYRGEGGLDSWLELVGFLYEISNDDIHQVFSLIKKYFASSLRLSTGQVQMMKLIDQLSEDKRYFWSEVIKSIEKSENEFEIKKKN